MRPKRSKVKLRYEVAFEVVEPVGKVNVTDYANQIRETLQQALGESVPEASVRVSLVRKTVDSEYR